MSCLASCGMKRTHYCRGTCSTKMEPGRLSGTWSEAMRNIQGSCGLLFTRMPPTSSPMPSLGQRSTVDDPHIHEPGIRLSTRSLRIFLDRRNVCCHCLHTCDALNMSRSGSCTNVFSRSSNISNTASLAVIALWRDAKCFSLEVSQYSDYISRWMMFAECRPRYSHRSDNFRVVSGGTTIASKQTGRTSHLRWILRDD